MVNMLNTNAAIKNLDGTPNVMLDETGAKVAISQYKVYKKTLKLFDFDDVFIKESESDQIQSQGQTQPQTPNGVPGRTGVPKSTANPQTASILNSANNLSQGVNV
jgi:hypothetical protein